MGKEVFLKEQNKVRKVALELIITLHNPDLQKTT